MPTNRETFIAHYERELHTEYDANEPWLARLAANPPDRPRTIPELAVRMTNGLVTGGANKDSAPIKRTCKALGVSVGTGAKMIVKTDQGKTFYRRKLTGSWLMEGGTWWLVQGTHNEKNPHF